MHFKCVFYVANGYLLSNKFYSSIPNFYLIYPDWFGGWKGGLPLCLCRKRTYSVSGLGQKPRLPVIVHVLVIQIFCQYIFIFADGQKKTCFLSLCDLGIHFSGVESLLVASALICACNSCGKDSCFSLAQIHNVTVCVCVIFRSHDLSCHNRKGIFFFFTKMSGRPSAVPCFTAWVFCL